MKLNEQEARVVLSLTGLQQWISFEELIQRELDLVRTQLEQAKPEQVQHLQGRATELRALLAVRKTAEAVLMPKTPIGTL